MVLVVPGLWESVHRVGLYIMSRLCPNMSSIRLIVIIRYPETDESGLKEKKHGWLILHRLFMASWYRVNPLCFVLIARVSDEQVGLMISLKLRNSKHTNILSDNQVPISPNFYRPYSS